MTFENYEFILNTLDKAENGPLVDEKIWDREIIGGTVRELVRKYEIELDPQDPFVPADDALADRLFEAGMKMAVQTGVYCVDTKRRMQWSRQELEQVLEQAPPEVSVGTGDDAAAIYARVPEDLSRVAVFGGPFGIPVSEELFIPFHQAYAREPLFDMVNLGTLLSTHGRSIRAGSPWEAVAAWQEKELAFEILDRVGRPGVALGCVEIATTEVGELAGTTYGGYRSTDLHKINFISEQKTAYHHLTEAVHYAHIGAFSEPYCNPMFGGYVGGADGVALAIVSGSILLKACYLGTLSNVGPTHVHISCSTHPDLVRATAVGMQALGRNTNLLTSPFVRPTTGPGTKEIFWETGALTIASVVSGCSYIDVAQSAAGTHAAHASPLEALFCGQLAHACEGMHRKDAEAIVRWMVDHYKDIQSDGLIGKPFQGLYDLETLEPIPEWNALYQEAREQLMSEFGLKL